MYNFNINTNGIISLKNKTKDFYYIIVQGFVIYFMLYFSFKYTIGNKGYFIFMTILLTVVCICTSIVIPISLKIRLNKVVRKIQIESNQISLFTNKPFIFKFDDMKCVEVKNRFTGFGIRDKSGILLKTKEGKEFWIVEDFYNDYEDLKLKLIAHKTPEE